MSAYSKEPGQSRLDTDPIDTPELRRPSADLDPMRTASYFAQTSGLPLVDELVRMTQGFAELKAAARDERRRADAIAKEAEQERTRVQQAFVKARAEAKKLVADLKRRELESHQLRKQIADLTRKVSELNHRASEAVRSEEAARGLADRLRAEISQLRNKAEKDREDLENRIRDEEGELRETAARFGRRRKELEDQVRSLEEKVRFFESADREARQGLDAAQGKLQALAAQLAEQKAATVAATRAAAQHEERSRQIREKYAAMDRALGDARVRVRDLTERAQALKDRNAALEREIQAVREANRALSGGRAAAESPTVDVARANTDLRQANAELRRAVEDLQSANAELRRVNDELGIRNRELERSAADSHAELLRTRKTLPLTQLLEIKERELAQLQAELQAMAPEDAARAAAISRRDTLARQRDQLAALLANAGRPR